MIPSILKLLKEKNVLFHANQDITVCTVKNQQEGIELADEFLHLVVDRKTSVYFSGGSMKALYERLKEEEDLTPGAVGLVDERFGDKLHDNSNEKMIKETGLLRYFHLRDTPFYPILKGLSREETAQEYDQTVRKLNSIFPKSVALLGIGADGHTAGIAGDRGTVRKWGNKGDKGDIFKNPIFEKERQHLFVSDFNDEHGYFKERITMTFLGLSMIDLLIILAFGENKKEALDAMFEDGPESEIPARFFKRPDIAKKTLFITDQSI